MRWLAVSVLAACFDPHPRAGAACAVGNRCPDGLGCIDGKCVEGIGPSDASSDVPGDVSLEGCPPPYIDTGIGCYRASAAAKSWFDAEKDCESDGGHLIVVVDVMEHSTLHTIAGASTPPTSGSATAIASPRARFAGSPTPAA